MFFQLLLAACVQWVHSWSFPFGKKKSSTALELHVKMFITPTFTGQVWVWEIYTLDHYSFQKYFYIPYWFSLLPFRQHTVSYHHFTFPVVLEVNTGICIYLELLALTVICVKGITDSRPINVYIYFWITSIFSLFLLCLLYFCISETLNVQRSSCFPGCHTLGLLCNLHFLNKVVEVLSFFSLCSHFMLIGDN